MIFQPIANQQYNTIFNSPDLVFDITIIDHKHPEEKGALQVTARHQVYDTYKYSSNLRPQFYVLATV